MDNNLKDKLERAQIQRFVALKNAFAVIDAFAIPTLDPYTFGKYEDVRKSLMESYGDGIEEDDTKFYTLKR